MTPNNERLRFCLVAKRFPFIGRGGPRGFLWPIARGLAKAGHEVTVLTWESPFNEPEIVQDGVKAIYLAKNHSEKLNSEIFSQRFKNKFDKLHLEKPFDLLHSLCAETYCVSKVRDHYGIATAYDVQATKMSEIYSIIGNSQDSASDMIKTGFKVAYHFLKTYYGHDKKLLDSSDGVFVASPQQKTSLERYYLYPERRTYNIPYGIEIGDLSPRQRSEELRRKLKIPETSKIAVTVTDMTEKREMETILRAFQKVAIKKPSSHLVVVGDGPLFKEIEYEMLCLALGRRVTLTGAVPSYEIPDYIDLADTFINLSSKATGFDPTMLEAMAQQKVVIGSEVSPIANVIENSQEGFIIRNADIDTLSQLLLDLFLGNKDHETIGQKAREKVMKMFDMNTMVNETLNSYQKILSGFKKGLMGNIF